MIPPFVLSLIPTVVDVFMGKKTAEAAVVGTGMKLVEQKTKGLIRSKTAAAATTGLGVKIVGVYMLPLPPMLQHGLALAALVEWGVNIYLRVKTHEKV